MNEYKFEELKDTPPQKHEHLYGTIIASRGALAVRRDGSRYSLWCDKHLIETSDNEEAALMIAQGMRKL